MLQHAGEKAGLARGGSMDNCLVIDGDELNGSFNSAQNIDGKRVTELRGHFTGHFLSALAHQADRDDHGAGHAGDEGQPYANGPERRGQHKTLFPLLDSTRFGLAAQ